MRITTTVMLEDDDNFAYTPSAGAMQVLVALGGNAANDYSELFLQSSTGGSAGTPPVTQTETTHELEAEPAADAE